MLRGICSFEEIPSSFLLFYPQKNKQNLTTPRKPIHTHTQNRGLPFRLHRRVKCNSILATLKVTPTVKYFIMNAPPKMLTLCGPTADCHAENKYD
jgi:hypothetical protein